MMVSYFKLNLNKNVKQVFHKLHSGGMKTTKENNGCYEGTEHLTELNI